VTRPVAPSDRVPVAAWVIAPVFVAAELALSGRYGFLQDELYFIAAGHHPAFGYVDQPPIAPLLTRVTDVLGVRPTALRVGPALAGAPVVYALAHLGITEPYDLLAWVVVLVCVSTAVLRDRPRWWPGAGVAAGLGLEDNNLMLLLLIGLAAGLLGSRHRAVLRTRWPWLGAALAALIWAPNVSWPRRC
jgi:4-amino-4-deoxy-L-arabinose transferase-like glycosyltransferase